jgi:hypothetical protein
MHQADIFRMDQIEIFRRHANECRQMARNTKDPESRAAWNSLAERCLHCADVTQSAMTMAARAADSHARSRKMRQWSEPDAR